MAHSEMERDKTRKVITDNLQRCLEVISPDCTKNDRYKYSRQKSQDLDTISEIVIVLKYVLSGVVYLNIYIL